MRGRAAGLTGALASAAAVLVVVGAGWQVPAAAHISLLSSDPAPGQRLEQVPDQARLEFSEPVSEPAYVVVTAPGGARSDPDTVRVDGATVVVDLPTGAEGAWALAFRVVSRDGHPVSGRVDFVVGDGAPAPPGVDPGQTPDRPAGQSGQPQAAPGTAARAPLSGEDGGGPSLGQVQVGIAVALFGGAAVLLLLSRPRTRRRPQV